MIVARNGRIEAKTGDDHGNAAWPRGRWVCCGRCDYFGPQDVSFDTTSASFGPARPKRWACRGLHRRGRLHDRPSAAVTPRRPASRASPIPTPRPAIPWPARTP